MKPKKTIAALLLMLSAGSASAMQVSETTPPATLTVAAFQEQLFEGKSNSLTLMALSGQEMKETKGAYLPVGFSNVPLPRGLRSWLDWQYWDNSIVQRYERWYPGCSGISCVPTELTKYVLGWHLF